MQRQAAPGSLERMNMVLKPLALGFEGRKTNTRRNGVGTKWLYLVGAVAKVYGIGIGLTVSQIACVCFDFTTTPCEGVRGIHPQIGSARETQNLWVHWFQYSGLPATGQGELQP